MAIATISWLDLVLVTMLVASIAFGFHQGLLRQICLMVSLYVAAVLSAQYHGHLASLLASLFPASTEMARVFAFALMLAALTFIVTWLIWNGYRQTRLPDAVVLDSLSGAVLGGVVGILVTSMAVVLAQYLLEAPWPEGNPIKYYLHEGLSDSAMQGVFRSPVPLIHATLRFWLPDDIPLMLNS